MNRLLRRQLQRYNIDVEAVPESFKKLILDVNNSYFHSEKERQLIEHTMDISSQELAEANKQLRLRKQKLEQYNEELKQFSYITAHDLKEPLRTIGSFIRLVERREPNISEESKEFIQFAIDGAERMKDLLDDLLKYTLIDAPNQSKAELLDLNPIIELVCFNLNTKIEENNVMVIRDDLPRVVGDKSQLMLLFQNLIDNSIKFRNSDIPQIKIESIRNFKPGYTKLSVIDNGIGIESSFQTRVFDIFEKLHNINVYKGTGIGLAICKKIVEKYSGEIWIDQDYVDGLKLDFTLPITII